MSARSYAGGAAASTLSSGIASGDTTFSVASATTWPSSGAFSIVIDRGLAGEEKVLVASRSGNTLTITTRGYDGTSAAAHSSGATVECCATATDFQEANDHINATTGHGATGAVVGTTNTQTLTNKTLTAPVIGTISNTGTLTLPTSTDTLVGRATTDTLTNKSISGSSNTLSNVPSTAVTGALSSSVATAESTASTTYTALATVGPAVTVTTGTSALVIVSAQISNSLANAYSYMGFAVSGATVVAATDQSALIFETPDANGNGRSSHVTLVTGLTPGSNTFTARYHVASGTGTFSFRTIIVIPLP